MSQVIKELKTIIDWEKNFSGPLTPLSLKSLTDLIEDQNSIKSIEQHNSEVAEINKLNIQNFLDSIRPWIEAYLADICNIISQSELIAAKAFNIEPDKFGTTPDLIDRNHLILVHVSSILLRRSVTQDEHCLALLLGYPQRFSVSFDRIPAKRQVEDKEVYFIPMYMNNARKDHRGFINEAQNNRPHISHVSPRFFGQPVTIFLKSRISQWPQNRERYRDVIDRALQVFLDYVKKGASIIY